MTRSTLIAVAILLAAANEAAQAQGAPADEVLKAVAVGDVVALLEGFGITPRERVELSPGNEFPRVAGYSANGTYFSVYLGDCTGEGAAATCIKLQYQACWRGNEIPSRKIPEANVINDYNAKRFFGRAYATDNGEILCVDYSILLDGGVTRFALRRTLAYWFAILDDVKRHFGL